MSENDGHAHTTITLSLHDVGVVMYKEKSFPCDEMVAIQCCGVEIRMTVAQANQLRQELPRVDNEGYVVIDTYTPTYEEVYTPRLGEVCLYRSRVQQEWVRCKIEDRRVILAYEPTGPRMVDYDGSFEFKAIVL